MLSFDCWLFGMIILCPVVKPVDGRELAFRDQLRLRRQPVLHLVPVQRTLVEVTEVWLAAHFVR
jgi:hypothetical protein